MDKKVTGFYIIFMNWRNGSCERIIKRDIGSYMLLKNQFVYFDFEEPLARFLLDYIAAMGLFVWVGHYLSKALKKWNKRKTAV